MKAIIVDDEEKLVENLQMMLDKINEEIICVGTAHNVLEGIKLIHSLKPDVVFLDINMPQHSGFELLDAIGEKDFIVVFTTAHEEYAIQAIKHRAFDYLLKPIDLDDLKTCVQKIKLELDSKQNKKSENQKSNPSVLKSKTIQIPIKEGSLLLKQEDIIHIQANGSYSIIHCVGGKKHTVTKNLKAMEEILDHELFFRCHNSFIINLNCVKKIFRSDGFSLEMEDGSVVEVSRAKKEELMKLL